MVNTNDLCMGCMNLVDSNSNVCPICGYKFETPYLPSYLAPKTILNDRYIVGKILSHNGERAIYLGYDKVTDTKVKITEFFPDTLCSRVKDNPDVNISPNKLVLYKNLLSEFNELNKSLSKMRTLAHVNAIVEYFSENNTSYGVFVYEEARTLGEYIKEKGGELSWADTKVLFAPLFTTLSIIHNSGVIHRGISLDTIIVNQKDEIILTDFCTQAARSSKSEIAPEIHAGFAAPEQYSSNRWLGKGTDIFAMAAVLYRALTGSMPTQSLSRIGNDNLLPPYKLNINVPKKVSDVIMEGLVLDEDKRISTMTQFVTKLFEETNSISSSRENTTTIIIPKQNVKQVVPTEDELSESNESEKKTKLGSTKIFTYVLFGILILATLVILVVFMLDSFGNNEDRNVDATKHEQSSINSESKEETSIIESSVAKDSSLIDEFKPHVVPNLVGISFDTLEPSIHKNFKIIVKNEYSQNETKEGIILSQDIDEGTRVEDGHEITIVVSKGPRYVEIPDFYGYTKEDYIDQLGSIKYIIEEIDKDSDQFEDGMVCDTLPAVQQKVDVSKDTVTVYVQKSSRIKWPF